MSDLTFQIGAVCFGIVVGYVTYRTLAKQNSASVADLAAVIAAIGGAAITSLFEAGSQGFGLYAIGLLGGFAGYLLLSLLIRGKDETGRVMHDDGALPG